MKDFAERLKYLREENGLTQKELAKICKVSPQCICCLEQRTRFPTGSTVAELARALNTSADYLLGLEDDFGVKKIAVPTPASDKLTAEERQLIESYREFDHFDKQLIKTSVETIAKKYNSIEKRQNKKL